MLLSVAGEAGSWINPGDNPAPAPAAPASNPADYDGNAITIQPGLGGSFKRRTKPAGLP